jgi:hypothetical protein
VLILRYLSVAGRRQRGKRVSFHCVEKRFNRGKSFLQDEKIQCRTSSSSVHDLQI